MTDSNLSIQLVEDLTGKNSTNYQTVIATLIPGINRIAVPKYGAFFDDSVVISDNATGLDLTSDQFEIIHYVEEASIIADKLISGALNITDPTVSNDISIGAQFVGGRWQAIRSIIELAIASINIDNLVINYHDLIGLPDGFPPADHLHAMGETYGWESVVSAILTAVGYLNIGIQPQLDELKLSILESFSGDIDNTETAITEFIALFQQHLDADNPHDNTADDVDLGDVVNDTQATTSVIAARVAAALPTNGLDNNVLFANNNTKYISLAGIIDVLKSLRVDMASVKSSEKTALLFVNGVVPIDNMFYAGTTMPVMPNTGVYLNYKGPFRAAQIYDGNARVYSPNNKVPKATPAADGLLPKEDKSKLDTVAVSANNYSHPALPLIRKYHVKAIHLTDVMTLPMMVSIIRFKEKWIRDNDGNPSSADLMAAFPTLTENMANMAAVFQSTETAENNLSMQSMDLYQHLVPDGNWKLVECIYDEDFNTSNMDIADSSGHVVAMVYYESSGVVDPTKIDPNKSVTFNQLNQLDKKVTGSSRNKYVEITTPGNSTAPDFYPVLIPKDSQGNGDIIDITRWSGDVMQLRLEHNRSSLTSDYAPLRVINYTANQFMCHGIHPSVDGIVVWLRSNHTYRITSGDGVNLAPQIYTSTFTDTAGETYPVISYADAASVPDKNSIPESIHLRWPIRGESVIMGSFVQDTSDPRSKDNIEKIDDEVLMELWENLPNISAYKWDSKVNGLEEEGFLTTEFEKVFPLAVTKGKNGEYDRLNHRGMIDFCIRMVLQSHKEVAKLKNCIHEQDIRLLELAKSKAKHEENVNEKIAEITRRLDAKHNDLKKRLRDAGIDVL